MQGKRVYVLRKNPPRPHDHHRDQESGGLIPRLEVLQMPSAVNSSTLEIDYLIISITVQKLDSEGAGTNLTLASQQIH